MYLDKGSIFVWADVMDAVGFDMDDTATARTLGHSLACRKTKFSKRSLERVIQPKNSRESTNGRVP